MQFQQPQKSSDRAERADPPRLTMPVSALVEAEQRFCKGAVRLPMQRNREGMQVKAYFPTSFRTMPSFKYHVAR